MTGKYGFYKGVQPLKDISPTVRATEQSFRQNRREQRIIDQQNKIQEEKDYQRKRQEGKEYEKGLEKIHLKSFDNKSHDEALMKVFTKKNGILDQYNEIHDILKNDRNNSKAIVRKENLFRSVENINAIRDAFVSKISDFQKGLDEGRYSKTNNAGLIKGLNGIAKDINYDFVIQEDGRMAIDTNGDEIPDNITFDDIVGSDAFKPKLKFQQDQWGDEHRDDYGTLHKVYDTPDGKRVELKGFDPSKYVHLSNDINNLFGANINSLTDEGKSFLGDSLGKDINNLSNDEFTEIKKEYIEKFIGSFDVVDKRTNSPGYKSNSNNNSEEENNYSLKENVDGIIKGIPKYLATLNIKGDKNQTRTARYQNGKIFITTTKINSSGEESEPNTVSIDTSDPEIAAREIIGILKGRNKIDETFEEYKKGKEPTFDSKDLEKVEYNKKVDKLPKKGKSQNIIKKIKSMGLNGFKDLSTGFWGWHNNIQTPSGEVYNVDTEDGMRDLKNYLKSEEYENDLNQNPKEETPKQKPRKSEIQKSMIAEKAKASGYTEEDYIQLLRENGIKIID